MSDFLQKAGAGTVVLATANFLMPNNKPLLFVICSFIVVLLLYGLYALSRATEAQHHMGQYKMTKAQRKLAGPPALYYAILIFCVGALALVGYSVLLGLGLIHPIALFANLR